MTRQSIRTLQAPLLGLLVLFAAETTLAEPVPAEDVEAVMAEETTLAEPVPAEAVEAVMAEEGPDLDGTLQLSLTEAVAMGIENNLQLQVERFDPIIANQDQSISWGAYDPLASANTSYVESTTPDNGNLLFSGSRTKEFDGTGSVDTLLPYLGASIGFDFTMKEAKNTGFITQQKPEWSSGYTIRGSQPLMKGLIWNEPWTRVKTSKIQYAGSLANFKGNLMDTVRIIENAYWDLVANRAAVGVARKSLETARSLLEQTETEYEVGVKSRVEVVEAEAGVAAREVELIRAVNLELRSQDVLIDAVLGTRLTSASSLEIEPTDDPVDYVTYEIDVPMAAQRAFENRPELAEARYEIERQELELKFAKNSRLPQLDVQASFGQSGSRGKGIEVEPGIFTETTGKGIGDTFNDWNSSDGGEDLRVGAVFSIPIGNVAARHTVSRRALELRRAETSLTRLRQDIILEVRDRARNLTSAQEGIEAAERRRLAAEEQLRAERVRLEYGESTPFNVLLKEEDLVEAENEKIGALRLYRTSVVDLNRAQGTILKARNIVVEEAAVLR